MAKLLIIEDNKTVIELTMLILGHLGVTEENVVKVNSYRESIEILSTEDDIAIVLVDNDLVDRSGVGEELAILATKVAKVVIWHSGSLMPKRLEEMEQVKPIGKGFLNSALLKSFCEEAGLIH